MLSIIETCVFEAEEQLPPVTRRDVGKGWGGVLGGLGGTLIGAGIGTALGMNSDSFGQYATDQLSAHDPQFSDVPTNVLGGVVGGAIGAGIGNITGRLGGRYIGGKTISNPDQRADFEKISHRVGYLANAQSHPLAVAGDVVGGATVGRSVGTMGANLYNAISDKGAAKRIGYQLPGRVGTALFGPWTGLFKPDKVNPNR